MRLLVFGGLMHSYTRRGSEIYWFGNFSVEKVREMMLDLHLIFTPPIGGWRTSSEQCYCGVRKWCLVSWNFGVWSCVEFSFFLVDALELMPMWVRIRTHYVLVWSYYSERWRQKVLFDFLDVSLISSHTLGDTNRPISVWPRSQCLAPNTLIF